MKIAGDQAVSNRLVSTLNAGQVGNGDSLGGWALVCQYVSRPRGLEIPSC